MPFLAAIPAAAVASAAAPAVGSLVGSALSSGDRDQAAAARAAALQQILQVELPSIEQQRVALAKQAVVGQLTPEMLGTVTEGPSHFEGISTDPRLREAQLRSLATLQGLGNTGLSAQDRVALMQIRNNAAGQAQAAEQATLQNLASRGMAGGGQELAARLIANQAAANAAGQQGMDVAAQAQNKALQAIISGGQLGSQLEAQQFGEKSDVARAQDVIQQFNAANRQNVMGTNVAAKNQAQAANLANAQDVANRNVDLQNMQERYNKELYQQQFQNQMQKARAASGAEETAAKGFADQAKETQGTWSKVGQGVGSGIAALANYKPSTPPAPTSPSWGGNETDPEAEGFIGPVRY